MPQQTSPFVAAKFGWDLGQGGWKDGMDENLLKFSFLFDGNVNGVVGTLPSPVNGDAYFLATDNRLYFGANNIWYSSPCPKYFIFKIKDSGEFYQFDGTVAAKVLNPTEIEGQLVEFEAALFTYNQFAEDIKNTTDPAKGAAIMGRGTQNARTIAFMEMLSPVVGSHIYLTQEGKAGDFVVKAGAAPADSQNGIYVNLANGTHAMRITDEWQSAWFINPTDTSFNPALAGAEAISKQGQTLRLGDSTLTLVNGYTDKLQIIGNSKASILKAGVGASQVMDFGRHAVDWDYHQVTNVTFDGNARTSSGARFNDDSATPHFGGRWSFQASRFNQCDKGVFQATGNIGNRYRDCNFTQNNFGIFAQDAPDAVMHTGTMLVEGCELNTSQVAAIYINDSQDGNGSWSIRDTIIEGNPGFGIFADLHGLTPAAGLTLENVWFEANASAATVTIDGVDYTPRDIYLRDASPVTARGVYLKDVELVRSFMVGYECRMDDASGACDIILDNDSSMVLHNAHADGQPSLKPMVMSIANQRAKTNVTASRGFRGPLRSHRAPISGTIIYANNFDGAGPFSFNGSVAASATSVADGVISDTCAELIIPNGGTVLGDDRGTPTPGKWAAFGVHVKLLSGSVPSFSDLGGGGSAFTKVAFYRNNWTCSYGVAEVGATVAQSRLRFINNTGAPITVRIADMFVVEFDTEAEALEFANSRAAPK